MPALIRRIANAHLQSRLGLRAITASEESDAIKRLLSLGRNDDFTQAMEMAKLDPDWEGAAYEFYAAKHKVPVGAVQAIFSWYASLDPDNGISSPEIFYNIREELEYNYFPDSHQGTYSNVRDWIRKTLNDSSLALEGKARRLFTDIDQLLLWVDLDAYLKHLLAEGWELTQGVRREWVLEDPITAKEYRGSTPQESARKALNSGIYDMLSNDRFFDLGAMVEAYAHGSKRSSSIRVIDGYVFDKKDRSEDW